MTTAFEKALCKVSAHVQRLKEQHTEIALSHYQSSYQELISIPDLFDLSCDQLEVKLSSFKVIYSVGCR